MAINIGSSFLNNVAYFERSAMKVTEGANKMDINKLTDGMVEMTLSEKLTKAGIKQIQAQDDMLGYIIDIKK